MVHYVSFRTAGTWKLSKEIALALYMQREAEVFDPVLNQIAPQSVILPVLASPKVLLMLGRRARSRGTSASWGSRCLTSMVRPRIGKHQAAQ